jgi:hypothetical protein
VAVFIPGGRGPKWDPLKQNLEEVFYVIQRQLRSKENLINLNPTPCSILVGLPENLTRYPEVEEIDP